ncbi:uncharacterized protein LOC132908030 isoform X7 [Bombus pascuorum]|uniref:uncharacterized protein LOC132908030 isoform X7 n=1 Tax=Bombus pascuorum TaxID=65598 RepID=UPI00298ECAAC|nr:uncharacterized protein LOC132908030 isoform X7 [Bombus pascuorum]
MTSLILENADLNRLFPKCRPRGGPPPSPGASTQISQPHESLCQKEAVSVTTSLTTSLTNTLATTFANTHSKNTHSTHSQAIPEDMIDLERDISDRTTNMVSGFTGDSQLSVGVSSGTSNVGGPLGTFNSLGALNTKPLSSSSSSASGHSEDAQQYGSLPGSDQQSHSQQDDSGPEESPVYILTSAKGDRSYKLRDSRIIEIAGGREVFSQSRGKVAARKSRFLAASNSLNNEDIQTDNKLSVKRNNKSPNTQTIWELRSRCGDTRKQRSNREVTETVFSSEIHSVRHNPTKSIDYDSPKSNHSNRIINYDSILNSNNVEYGISKNTADLDYGLSKSCIDYQSNHTTPARSMAIVSDGEVVVFDDIDDNWQNLRLDLTSNNTNQVTPTNLSLETEESQRGRIPPEPLSSSIGSTPSPTTAYHRNTSEFFKVITPASDCEVDSPSSERNHKVTRVIGELPIAQYSESPRRYGVRDTQLPCLLSSPSVYMTPRPGFPQRVLPTTPSHNEKEDTSAEIIVEKAVVETNINYSDDQAVNASPPSPKIEDEEEDSLKPSTIPTDNISNLVSSGGSTFDYLYEFSETRKVLEEFFKCPPPTKEKENSTESFPFQDLDYELRRQGGSAYVGQRLASGPPTTEEVLVHESPKKQRADFPQNAGEHENNFLDLSVGTGSSEDLGETEVGLQVGHSRNFTLSPETTDCDSNCGDLDSEVSLMMMDNELIPASGLLGSVGDLGNNSDSLRIYASMPVLEDGLSSGHASDTDNNNPTVMLMKRQINEIEKEIIQRSRINDSTHPATTENDSVGKDISGLNVGKDILHSLKTSSPDLFVPKKENSYDTNELQLDGLDPLGTPPPPAPQARQSVNLEIGGEVEAAIKDIRMALQRTKTLPVKSSTEEPTEPNVSPIWIPSLSDGRRRICVENNSEESEVRRTGEEADVEIEEGPDEEEADTDLETDRLLGQQRTDDQGFYDDKEKEEKKKSRNKEVLIEGVLFRARYLGSTQLVCEGEPTKSTRMCQAEEAVSRIKAPDGETQPSTEVDLFISTEKIMVLNTDLKEIMMDHALRTISYIADIGDVVVLMARRRFVPHEMEEAPKINRTPKMICHVFESEEARFIAQSIGQAFQVAYMEFLKANGIEDHSFVKEMDYQEVLNSQEIFGDELQMFAKKEMQKEVVVPKAKGEILGVVIVESGWGSMLPTVVIANLAPAGAAARCGQLNIGDQIIAINGVSLVGLPLSTCQTYIKNSKNQTVVKLTVVPCAPVVEVKIKRPDTKYQLGFSVQNGVICSLLRGGIAERGGVRVGHRIIEINNQSVVAVPHEKIVNLLATSVGEILMKTMPTSMFRLLTGQESPVYI